MSAADRSAIAIMLRGDVSTDGAVIGHALLDLADAVRELAQRVPCGAPPGDPAVGRPASEDPGGLIARIIADIARMQGNAALSARGAQDLRERVGAMSRVEALRDVQRYLEALS